MRISNRAFGFGCVRLLFKEKTVSFMRSKQAKLCIFIAFAIDCGHLVGGHPAHARAPKCITNLGQTHPT
jgi:hypothetical protein